MRQRYVERDGARHDARALGLPAARRRFRQLVELEHHPLATTLPNGASLDFRLLMGIQQTGTFKLYVNVEALPRRRFGRPKR
jgi:hypothetical protein